MKETFIIGKRIILRSLKESDLKGPYVTWFNDAQVCQYNSHHFFPYYKEQAREYIKKVSGSGRDLVLAIVKKDTKAHIGNISLQRIDYLNRTAEFAIIIGDKKCWGKGYAKEAGCLIVHHGFTQLNLNRIYCGTSSENIPMQKLALYLGMKKEGKRRKALFKSNKYSDILEYGVLKNEFNLEAR
jgi:RimJ/RimL family protein N-acetyltransferase